MAKEDRLNDAQYKVIRSQDRFNPPNIGDKITIDDMLKNMKALYQFKQEMDESLKRAAKS